MDPTTVLAELLNAIAEPTGDDLSRAIEVRELADYLATWIERGGFPPSLAEAYQIATGAPTHG